MRPAALLASLLASFLAICAAAPPARFTRGSPRELRGVTRISVVCEDQERAELLAGKIREEIPEIEIVASPDEAEALVVVTFRVQTFEELPPAAGSCNSCSEAARFVPPRPPMIRAVATIIRPHSAGEFRTLLSRRASGAAEPIVCDRIARDVASAWRKANSR